MANILFVCTSNKDRSPALEKYFKIIENDSMCFEGSNFRSAGVNKYFTAKHGTKLITLEDIAWANCIVYAEEIHKEITHRMFPEHINSWAQQHRYSLKKELILGPDCGEFKPDANGFDEAYLTKAEQKLIAARCY